MAKYFYNGNGDALPASYVEDVQQEYKGTTMDGDAVYHVTFFDARRRKHISYDTVVYRGEHEYITGSGHERDHGRDSISRWDSGNRVTWQEALRSHTRDLLPYSRR